MSLNRTGDTGAVPSLRYVVSTAGDGRSRRSAEARDQSSGISAILADLAVKGTGHTSVRGLMPVEQVTNA
jgi:hypothetical protein